jgi:DNA-binding response OmpR family regulator
MWDTSQTFDKTIMMAEKQNKTILIVDDSSTNNLLFQSIFEENGFDVIVSTSGKAGLSALDKNKADLVLLDVMMPGLDGFDVLKTIKEDKKNQSLPVLMLTAKKDSESMKKALDMGAADYLIKPVGIKEIVEKIKKVLNIPNS